MAKKLVALTTQDIILQADAETIRAALEARVQIDELLIKREEAYQKIAEIELQVEELVGDEGAFVYPAPPVPVAGFAKPVPVSRPTPSKPKPKKQEPEAERVEEKKDEVAEKETLKETPKKAEEKTEE